MDRILSRKQASDDRYEDDMLEVDKISFTSFPSSDEDDLRMSVQQSPFPSSYSDFKSASELSLHCKHRSDSECEPDASSPSCSRNELGCLEPTPSCSTVAEDTFEQTSVACPVSSSALSDEAEVAWLKQLYVTSDLTPLPEVVSQQPYWRSLEKELIVSRQRDASISKDLEESNIYLYALRLTLGAVEEARWLNDVSKDPELSLLVHQIDPKFPLAVNHAPAILHNCEPASDGHGEAGDVPAQSGFHSLEDGAGTDIKPTYFSTWKRPNRRPRTYDSAFGSPARKPEISWSELACSALESFISTEPLRDHRVASWIDDAICNTDKLLALPSTSQSVHEELSQSVSKQCSTGDLEWTPPLETWIYTLWKSESVKVLLEAQHFRCFGCGIRVEKEYMKRVMFDARCIPYHTTQSVMHHRAVCFCIEEYKYANKGAIGSCIATVEKIRVLKHVITLREKLSYMWDFVKGCPDAETTETKNGHLRTLFTSLEQHLLQSRDLFSLSDLILVHNKDMISLLEPIAYFAGCHIETCEHCKQFATLCVYCEDNTELLFPFQLEKIYKCASCASLTHIKCQAKFRRKVPCRSGCKRCLRLAKDK